MKKTNVSLLLIVVVGILFSQPVICQARQNQPILERIGVTRGICVVLGDKKCEYALELIRPCKRSRKGA